MEKSDHQRKVDRKLPPSPKVAPWLVFPHGKDGKFHSFYNIYDDADEKLKKRSLNKFIPELSKKNFRQKDCHQGWLIVLSSDDTSDPNCGDCFLWNPQTLDIIQLPSVLEYYETEGKYWLKDCLLTSPPQINTSISSNSNSDSSSSSDGDNSDRDSMVYFLFEGGNNGDHHTLLFCHPGEKEWRRHDLNVSLDPRSMLYLKNKLYLMGINQYYEIEVQGGSDVDDDETLAVGDIVCISRDNIAVIESTGMLCSFMEYYVESFGEIFRIHTWFIRRGIYSNGIRKIEILKLDFATMAWENVRSLGDRVFFISYDTQLSCLASDLGFPEGCMYFTQDQEMSLYKYDLEDQSILLSVPCPDLPTPWFQPEWLMITTTLRLDDKKQTTSCISGKRTENATRVAWADEKDDNEEARLGILASDDLVWLVSKQLHRLDYIHLRAVSKRYRAILNLKRLSSDRTIQTTNLSPWLVFSNFDRSTFSFINPLHNNEKYLLNVTEMFKGFRICFSKGGWFLMSKHPKLFFHNPFTRSSIKLPDFTPENIRRFSCISFSCLPTSSDCTVFAIGKERNGNVSIFYIKRGEQCWRHGSFADTYVAPNRKLMKFHFGLNNPVFHEGSFYCLDLNGIVGISKYENGIISWDVLSTVPQPNCEFIYESYLVECEGKLLCVLLGHMGKWVRIFKLNNSKTVWVEVENLGRHMLCISNTSCISSVAPTSQMENKIFFSRLHEEGTLFYSLDTGMYHCLGSKHSAKDYRDSGEMLCCSWIEPDWSQISDRFSDWLSF